jgi:hypothetical protein
MRSNLPARSLYSHRAAVVFAGLALLLSACPVDDPLRDDDDAAVDDDDTTAADDDDATLDPTYAPAVYPADQVHSPITPWVADRLWDLGKVDPLLQDDVFMKVGASSTVSHSTLYCFAEGPVDLGAYSHLQDTLDFFLAGDAEGSSPFDRETLAAISGRTAGWAISGDPSPLEEELEALDPRFALIHYGTNDMGMGSTYGSAMPGFYANMMDLIEQLVDLGIVPILTGITHRADSAAADLWVPSYNAAIRGMAQSWQIPFIDLFEATEDLDGYGLSGDGLHLNGYPGGACLLSAEGLDYGYNVRNLIVLEAFDRARRVVSGGEEQLDPGQPPLEGDGSPESPFLITSLPFADSRSTLDSAHSNLDLYTGCASSSDESGPEFLYRLDLTDDTAVRAFVLDRDGVDIDVHLLRSGGTEADCVDRGHHRVEIPLEAGTWLFSLDTWVDDGGLEQSGDYLFVVLECEPTDGDCGAASSLR